MCVEITPYRLSSTAATTFFLSHVSEMGELSSGTNCLESLVKATDYKITQ